MGAATTVSGPGRFSIRDYNHSQEFQAAFTCRHGGFFSNVPGVVREIWEQSILAYNLPFTILLGLVVLFWLLTLLGAVSSESLDVDLDADADLDGDASHLSEIPAALLRLVNAGYVPVTVVLSILILVMWIVSITFNYYFNPGHSSMLALGFAAVAFVLGVIATKVITQPLVPFMRRLKAAENAAPVIGEVGIVRSIRLDSEFGQVEVERPDGAPALLNARLGPDSEPVPRGTEVAIVSYDDAKGIYLVRPLPSTPPID